MVKKAVEIMFVGCFASPLLLGFLLGKDVFYPMVAKGNMAAGMLVFYLPILFLLSGFEDKKMNGWFLIRFVYGIITFCVGAFLTLSLSWWYLLISLYAFIFLLLLAPRNHATR